MDGDFVRNRLFHPFASTKPGGFGIGAFEARSLIMRWADGSASTAAPGAELPSPSPCGQPKQRANLNGKSHERTIKVLLVVEDDEGLQRQLNGPMTAMRSFVQVIGRARSMPFVHMSPRSSLSTLGFHPIRTVPTRDLRRSPRSFG